MRTEPLPTVFLPLLVSCSSLANRPKILWFSCDREKLSQIHRVRRTVSARGSSFMVVWTNLDWREVGQRVSSANPYLLVLAVVIICLAYGARAFRWGAAKTAGSDAFSRPFCRDGDWIQRGVSDRPGRRGCTPTGRCRCAIRASGRVPHCYHHRRAPVRHDGCRLYVRH